MVTIHSSYHPKIVSRSCATSASAVRASSAYAAGDQTAVLLSGQKQFTACASCHGADGQQTTSPRYPKIGEQNSARIIATLKAYRDSQRTGTEASLMAAMTKPVSNSDISSLAACIPTCPQFHEVSPSRLDNRLGYLR
ncbi:c-type cytochrome [Burkholderia cepacia]|uniref:c-type cytochrome n=1 Tax=Burkholderia cepacia TaxID=292 RepID=UPI001C9555E7|nr:c-type cytochrome [Burkholderia cepacia]